MKPLATRGANEVFYMKPDISLMSGGKADFILDTKWKRINAEDGDLKLGINQADMYQMFVYGKKYGCSKVALVYPKTKEFDKTEEFKFDEELSLVCVPFDVKKPCKSVTEILNTLQS